MAENKVIQPHPYFTKRTAGVLLHVTSLPGRHGIGDFGPSAYRFLDWLYATGWKIWQVLPIGPLGAGDSPYSSPSTFAIEPLLISLDSLADDGLLSVSATRSTSELQRGNVNYKKVRRFKEPRLLEAFNAFHVSKRDRSKAFRNFLEQEANWLDEWCAWASENRGGEPDFHAFVQFMLARQWRALSRACHARGILIFGDLPIFVPLASADVASHPKLFRLDRKGKPTVLTGVPPDRFNHQGQLWGHPQYNWPEHERTRFRWWVERIAKQFERFDIVRIDHFIGMYRAWHIPAGARTARRGTWRRSPGRELLKRLFKALDSPALVAEDLGLVTPPVRRLKDDFALPGMSLLQNAFDRDDANSLPHNLQEHSLVYPGTHDNDTTLGWWRSLPATAKRRVRDYAGPVGAAPHEVLLRLALASRANAAIIPMQDLLGLGRSARMNTPGSPTGNWRWRVGPGMLHMKDAAGLNRLAAITGRLDRRGAKHDPKQ